jgi:(S)-ureidoglycine aminohydrolase
VHQLGSTRSSLKPDHLLQTPDTFIRSPLPGAEGVEFIIHAAPQLGARFTQMTAEFVAGGSLPPASAQRFVYVLDGKLELKAGGKKRILKPGGFAYLPEGFPHTVRAPGIARAALIEKPYEPQPGSAAPEIVVGDEAAVTAAPLLGDPSLRVRALMPDGPPYDFAVNIMTYDPGASLSMVEIHVMEHGLLMLEGGGIYRLGDSWYSVYAGDFIWMRAYCPQWFGALGKRPAKYLLYKDWRRHPLGEQSA